MTNSQNK
jgi:hypothetical protein